MFSFHCPTCESKLIVKDETLIGHILNCPKCGGMVLVQPSDASSPLSPLPPDVLSQEHVSGITGHLSESEQHSDIFQSEECEPDAADIEVPETEIKARQFLIGILIGLSILLLIILGNLMVFRKPNRPAASSPPQQTVQKPSAVQPPAPDGNTEILPPAIKEPETQKMNKPDSSESAAESHSAESPHGEADTSPMTEGKPLPESEAGGTPNPADALPVNDLENQEHTEQKNTGQEGTKQDTMKQENREQENSVPAMPAGSGYADTGINSVFRIDSISDINMDAKLALPILEWNLQQCRLIDFIRSISAMTGIPMTLEIDALKASSLSIASPVDGLFRETTAEQILTETLDSLALKWSARDKQILIMPKETSASQETTPPNNTRTIDAGTKEEWVFDVSDFAEKTDDLSPEVLADWLQKLVCPKAIIEILPGNRLCVYQQESEQKRGDQKNSLRTRHEILRFFEQLRVIRQLPQTTNWAGEQLAPEAFGWDSVMEPFTLNYYSPIPLSQAVSQIESNSPLTILIDHQSLHRAGISYSSIRATVRCDHGTLHDTMELLLASVDTAPLIYRIIDHQTLEITTAESAALPEKMSMEVHRYQLPEGETPESFLRSLQASIAPKSWAVEETDKKGAGKKIPNSNHALGGSIVMDEPSGCMFIRQSQPVQRHIRLYLSAAKP